MLLKLSLALLSILAVYVVYCIWEVYQRKRGAAEAFPLQLVLVVKNQENGIEFFIRRVMAERKHYVLGLEVVVVDAGSCDDTPRILRRMSRMFGFKFIEAGEEDGQSGMNWWQKAKADTGENVLSSHRRIFYYDVRGMSDLELSRAPLFLQLLTQR